MFPEAVGQEIYSRESVIGMNSAMTTFDRASFDEVHARNSNELNRLSTPTTLRTGSALGAAFLVGTILGVSHGSKMSGMRFRAENSHRFPTTSTGWYLYHKTKNYHVMLGGIKEGLKMGLKTSMWTGGFFMFEYAIDHLRQRQDCLSSTIAGLTIAGNFSWLSKCYRTGWRIWSLMWRF